ncbi:unnamed protein product [Darwinula stevensoni]|uniref:C-type lectin domain-containing protein n=1 Tax=Darwinula stevensoni TaxID=69355 RepID=A0A7R9FS04_9CRUS|nr:unnamed protein product [Darwinula stevensoni]CAG0902483.1 unnamed protein product [Darwinula stevensoni]
MSCFSARDVRKTSGGYADNDGVESSKVAFKKCPLGDSRATSSGCFTRTSQENPQKRDLWDARMQFAVGKRDAGMPGGLPGITQCYWALVPLRESSLHHLSIVSIIPTLVYCLHTECDEQRQAIPWPLRRSPLQLLFIWATVHYVYAGEKSRQAGCDPDWLPFGDHCYYFSKGPANQTEARTFCLDQGGDLVSIHSPEEQKFVEENVVKRNSLIGAYPTGSLFEDPWNFAFFDGTPSDYQQVADYGPSHRRIPATGSSSSLCCGRTWTVPGPEPMTYEDAVQHCPTVPGGCEGAYGTFLSPNHYVRDAFINYMRLDSQNPDDVNGDHPGRYWMGLRRNPESGQWETPSGSPFNATTGWHWDGYPTEDGGDCASLFVSSWVPTFVQTLYGFVCKRASLT